MKRTLFAITLLIICCALPLALFAALTEKDFRRDMAYYQKISKEKNLNANDRLFILNRLREKYKDVDVDVSELYSAIDKWSGAKQKETAPGHAKHPAKEKAGSLMGVFVTEGDEFSTLNLEIPGVNIYKESAVKDDKNLQPPVIVVLLYNTKNRLKESSRNFRVKSGAIRQVQAKTLSNNPSTVKVSISLREDLPYKITRDKDKLLVAFNKGSPKAAGAVPADETGASSEPANASGVTSPTILPAGDAPTADNSEKNRIPDATVSTDTEKSPAVFTEIDGGTETEKSPGKIWIGDILKIQVTPAVEFSQSVVVKPGGQIDSLAGTFDASGHTIKDLEKHMRDKLSEFVTGVKVRISIQKFSSKQVFITGQVKAPGSYDYTAPESCLEFISKIGGFLPDADKKNVVIYRAANGKRKKLIFNAESFLNSADKTLDVPLYGGDLIEVNPSANFVFVTGSVKSQGRYEYKEGMKLMQAIYLAGGFTDKALSGSVRILRKDQGKEISKEFNAKDILNNHPDLDPALKQGDLVLVPEKDFMKEKFLNRTSISWMSFFASLGIILALVI